MNDTEAAATGPVSSAPGEVRRRPVVAAVLSLVVPGVGQLYNGEVVKANAFYVGTLVVGALWLLGVTGRYFWGLVVTLALTLLLRFWTVIDAAVVARRRRIVPAHPFSRWPVLATVAIALALPPPLLMRAAVVKSFYFPSSSMEPTIQLNERVIADLSYFRHRPLTVGSIAMFRSPVDPSVVLAKRVVAVAGDRVEIRDKQLFVNGQRVDEPWAVHRDPTIGGAGVRGKRDHLAPTVVPSGTFFALGDNRDESFDSRFFGPVPLANLAGKVLFVYWSDDRSRIGRSL
jgi:signal peptidase I